MSGGRRNKKNSSRSKDVDFGGMNPAFITSIIRKINAASKSGSGKPDMNDIMQYMSEHPEDMEGLMAELATAESNGPEIDFSTFDFNTLAHTIKKPTYFVLQLEHMGILDASGREIDQDTAHTVQGARPWFQLYCYDDEGTFRATQTCTDLPKSDFVLQTIQRAISKPLPPVKPSIPSLLLLSRKLEGHVEHVKPFLDSLPAPFTWRVETPEEADGVNEGVHRKNEEGVRAGLTQATISKNAGNDAFKANARDRAVKAYSDALEHLVRALSQKPDLDDEKAAKSAMAVCYANRAAAWLLEGDGLDAEKALDDAQRAEKFDPLYAKGYFRQAKALKRLGRTSEAQDVLADALKRREIENDKGLVDLLIDLQTDGKGFANDEGVFKGWLSDILINDGASAKRMKGVEGEYQRRVGQHMTQWKR